MKYRLRPGFAFLDYARGGAPISAEPGLVIDDSDPNFAGQEHKFWPVEERSDDDEKSGMYKDRMLASERAVMKQKGKKHAAAS